MTTLAKKQILQYLEELSTAMARKNLKGEILLFGGAAMILAFNARSSTKDVDAIFRPKKEIYAISKEIADKHHMSEGWLNDSVKGFITSDSFKQNLFIRYSNLSVYTPEPQYLLAMKCMSMRIGAESSDIDDIKTLLKYLKIKKAEDVFSLIEKYYPQNKIPQKTFYAIDEILKKLI
jgi:hypothetical protein